MSNKPIIAVAATAAVAVASYLVYTFLESRPEQSQSGDGDTATDLQEVLKLPLIDLSKFFNREKDAKGYYEECLKVADALHNYGVLIIKDPRVNEADNDRFIDMMEKYFESSDGEWCHNLQNPIGRIVY